MPIVEYSGVIIEYFGISIVIYSVIEALAKVVSPKYNIGQVRSSFAKHVMFGLEFVIAADILLVTVASDLGQILQLGGIVVIRVLLGYALRKEALK
jgi:uncharacterized membrane protein